MFKKYIRELISWYYSPPVLPNQLHNVSLPVLKKDRNMVSLMFYLVERESSRLNVSEVMRLNGLVNILT